MSEGGGPPEQMVQVSSLTLHHFLWSPFAIYMEGLGPNVPSTAKVLSVGFGIPLFNTLFACFSSGNRSFWVLKTCGLFGNHKHSQED